jgi:hypothetical protein
VGFGDEKHIEIPVLLTVFEEFIHCRQIAVDVRFCREDDLFLLFGDAFGDIGIGVERILIERARRGHCEASQSGCVSENSVVFHVVVG